MEAGPACSQDPGTTSKSPKFVAGTNVLEQSSASSHDALARSWIGTVGVRLNPSHSDNGMQVSQLVTYSIASKLLPLQIFLKVR